MKSKGLLVFVFALFFLGSSGVAQELENRFGVGLYGSAVKMVLGSSDRSTVDQWAGLSLSYGLTNNWLLSLNDTILPSGSRIFNNSFDVVPLRSSTFTFCRFFSVTISFILYAAVRLACILLKVPSNTIS